MLLRNWYVYRMIKEVITTREVSGVIVNMNNEGYQFKKGDGTIVTKVYIDNSESLLTSTSNIFKVGTSDNGAFDLNKSSYSASGNNGGINLYPVIGSGNKDVIFDDYNMQNPYYRSDGYYSVISGGTLINNVKDDGKGEILSISINCKALKDMTINEVGLQGTVRGSGVSNDYSPILLIREVLETPIEVVANQTFTLNFEIEMPYPSILETPIVEASV